LTKFKDSSLDFILRLRIDGPVDGLSMRGAVMLALRDGFMHDSPLENMCGFFIAGRYHNRTPFLAGRE
jgi:hypothetical protein